MARRTPFLCLQRDSSVAAGDPGAVVEDHKGETMELRIERHLLSGAASVLLNVLVDLHEALHDVLLR